MAGYGVIFVFIAVGLALVIFGPLFALLGFAIFRGKHRSGKQGALLGAIAPLLGGAIGIMPYFLGIVFTIPMDTLTGIGIYVPLLSIPTGIMGLAAMMIV